MLATEDLGSTEHHAPLLTTYRGSRFACQSSIAGSEGAALDWRSRYLLRELRIQFRHVASQASFAPLAPGTEHQ